MLKLLILNFMSLFHLINIYKYHQDLTNVLLVLLLLDLDIILIIYQFNKYL